MLTGMIDFTEGEAVAYGNLNTILLFLLNVINYYIYIYIMIKIKTFILKN